MGNFICSVLLKVNKEKKIQGIPKQTHVARLVETTQATTSVSSLSSMSVECDATLFNHMAKNRTRVHAAAGPGIALCTS